MKDWNASKAVYRLLSFGNWYLSVDDQTTVFVNISAEAGILLKHLKKLSRRDDLVNCSIRL